jgi:hypothetical protein
MTRWMLLTIEAVAGLLLLGGSAQGGSVKWKHLSSVNGDLAAPNPGKEQTASLVCDIDKDGVNDFAIAERTQAPALVWYRRSASGWTRYVVEAGPLHIEAGSDALDIDGDGDLDIVFAGDFQNNKVWWWENPYPDFDPQKSWTRHTIKDFGGTKHHDLMFGDFNGDGRQELVFWNQGSRKLYLAEIPENPRQAGAWKCTEIYAYSNDSEMFQRQTRPYPGFKGINEHEGLAKADIDGDGKLDIVGGGRWFKHIGGATFAANIIDAGYQFSRAAAGQLIEGGRPEVILVVGDGWAPLMMYEWQKGTWVPTELIREVDCGHSLALVDFNKDGHLDIWVAEMRLNGGNPKARNVLLLGDGKGHFRTQMISEGIANHESKIADLDGDGDYDVLDKPYGWETPRFDIWLNEGPQ